MSIDGAARQRLVIFDCDGVLVDSEPIAVAVLLDLLAESGVEMPLDEGYRRFLGRSLSSIAADLSNGPGVVLTPAHLAELRRRMAQRFRSDLTAVPHVREAVSALDAPICVASSSQPERLALSLDLTGLRALFAPHIFSAVEVAYGKPAPDLFLHAAAQMGVAPDACLVVEDSPAGIQAAKAAGMPVVGFVGGAHAGPADLQTTLAALDPDAMIDDMRALPKAINALPRR